MRRLRLSVAIAALTLMSALTQQAAAHSWRINSNTTRKAHFTDINAAMSSSDVVDGDTLYLDPGCELTAAQVVTKQVTIVGPGYFLTNAPYQSAVIKGYLSIMAPYVKVEGCCMTGVVYIEKNHVTLERCYMTNYVTIASKSSYTAQYATIRQCYSTSYFRGAGTDEQRSAYCTIENCIIQRSGSYCIGYLNHPTIRNNYVLQTGSNTSYRCLEYINWGFVANNILLNPKNVGNLYSDCSNMSVAHNVLSAANTSYPDNIVSDEASVFALEGSNDQRYTLKADSPAKGYATDGGDCGPTGGSYPYVCSGFPLGMPRMVSSSATTRPESGQVKVTQSVTTQNQ